MSARDCEFDLEVSSVLSLGCRRRRMHVAKTSGFRALVSDLATASLA